MQEALDGGQLDLLKGSFYANPMQDNEDLEAPLRQQYPSYCRQCSQPLILSLHTHVLCFSACPVTHCNAFSHAKP